MTINVPDKYWDVYIDIANFDQYDMIISMLFMRDNKVQLDFDDDWVIINGIVTSA